MVTDRERVVDALRMLGEHDRALQASCALPPRIDTERDAGLLHQLGVPPGLLPALAAPEQDAVTR